VDLYIHSPIRLHSVVLNQLNTGVTLPLIIIIIIIILKIQNIHANTATPVLPCDVYTELQWIGSTVRKFEKYGGHFHSTYIVNNIFTALKGIYGLIHLSQTLNYIHFVPASW
jgi:hypothetical protein